MKSFVKDIEFAVKEHVHLPSFIRRRPETLDYVIYLSICVTIFLLLDRVGFNLAQRIATTIFVGIALGTLMFWRFRLAVALIGISLMLFTNTMPLQKALLFMNLDVIIFLVSMMIIVEQLEHVGFFKWLGFNLANRTRYDPVKLMVAFMGLSAFTAAFIDEVTSILIVSAMILRTCQFLGIRPLPYILAAVFATNIGSATTVIGNPVGILVAFRAGLTFEDYLGWATPIAIAAFTAVVPLCLMFFRRTLKSDRSHIATRDLNGNREWEVMDRRRFNLVVGIFLAVIVGIVLHVRTEALLNLDKNTMLVATPLLGAGIILLMDRQRAREIVEKGVDWWTILFFMFLFSMAGAMAATGVTGKMAQGILNFTGGDQGLMVTGLLWGSAILSGGIDNVPVISVLIETVLDLGEMSVFVFPLWWALVLGGTFGGNLTMVGSTANIVALGVLEKAGEHPVKFLEWFKFGLVIVLVTVSLANALLLLRLLVL